MDVTSEVDLAPFVPAIALELAARPGSHWTSVDGSMLSADISGFTALSERLAAKGKAGAEEITELVNECFVELIDAAYGYGGEIIKFGGDAIFVLFRGDDHQRRCGDAALLMQRVLHATKASKSANLTMSVGASHGPFDVFVVGSSIRDLLIVGPAATQVVHLEGEAAKGETLVSEEIAAHVAAAQHGRRHAGGIAITGNPGQPPSAPIERPASDAAELVPFVPVPVAEQFAAFERLGGEHRLVTVGFVSLTGIAEHLETHGPDETAHALGAFVDELAARCDRFGVTLLHTDVAPDGLKTVLCAGAPVNAGDNADAMLRVALEMAAVDTPFTIKQGIGRGRVFAGFLGADYRRTYTIMGDTVNTSARLLGPCEAGGILSADGVIAEARGAFRSEAIEPFVAKGKSELVYASRLIAADASPRVASSRGVVLGRDREQAMLTEALRDRRDDPTGAGSVIEIVAQAGIGKSHLLATIEPLLEEFPTVYRGGCTPYGAATPYGLARDLLRSGLGIALDAPPARAGSALEGIVDQCAPDLRPLLPLIAGALGADVEATPESRAIGSDFRRGRMHQAVGDLLRATGERIVVIAEDLHWVDDASGELLSHLLGLVGEHGWSGIVTRRPSGTFEVPPETPGLERLALEPLSSAAVERLAIRSASRSLTDAEVDAVMQRADGNPLFAIELARAVSKSSIDEVPDSVEQVIAARLDALDPQVRHLIRVAAVMGNSFSSAAIEPVLETLEIGRSLDDTVGIDVLISPVAGEWEFTHALYRDVAYEGLPFSQRKRLHGVCGDVLESRAASVDDVAPLLSVHFFEARNATKAWRYSAMVGRAAFAQNAYADAAVALGRALQASRRLRAIDVGQRVEVAIQLAEANAVTGNYDAARQVLKTARRLNESVAVEVDLMRRMGFVDEQQGRYSAALTWFSRSLSKIESDTQDVDELVARSRVLLARAGVLHRRGDNHGCARVSHEALADAERAQNDHERSLAYARLHLAHVHTSSKYADFYGESALRILRDLGDVNSQARVLINMGVHQYKQMDWTAASDYYRQAADAGAIVGNVTFSASAALNGAEILSDQGHWEQACAIYENVWRNFEAIGFMVGQTATALFHGTALTRMGHCDAARSMLQRGLELARLVGLDDFVDDAELRLVELEAVDRPTDLWARRAGVRRRFTDCADTGSRLDRTLGLAAFRVGERGVAQRLLEEALGASPDSGLERALTLDALVSVVPESERHLEWNTELSAICERLDIAAFPPVVVDAAPLNRR